jgi:Xaa-Pro aminopeptidase
VEHTVEPQVEVQLSRRRSAAAAAWNLTDQLVLIGSGDLISIPGRADLTYPFRPHTEYYYLTDSELPGGVLAFDPDEGWLEFAAPLGPQERLWLGLGVDGEQGRTTRELGAWLKRRTEKPIACLGVPVDGVKYDTALSEELRAVLNRIRRPKDPLELERMRIAQDATRAAFATVVPLLRDGTSEREAQIEFEAEAFRNGAGSMAYDTIIASGPNSAALHFAPTARQMRTGELVLIDAGAEYRGYASDITRTYPAGGAFASAEQQELHGIVRAAELEAIAACGPGTEWRDVHLIAARVIAEGLVGAGILRGTADELIESGAVWLFFPHGVGHLLGLGVRDAGGILPERRDSPPPFPHLRIDLPLEPGMVVTVEPGVYFVRTLLEDPEKRRTHAQQVAWERVDRMLDFGGIRIEDNVLITEVGHEVITENVPLLG